MKLVACLAVILYAALAQANPTITSSVSNPRTTDSAGAYYVPIKTDLVNSDQSTFSSLTTTYPNDWNSGNQGRLNDGMPATNSYGGNKWNSAHHSAGPYPAVITFALNTTLYPNGYDISSIVSSSADWRDGRYWQKYLLEYHTVGGGWTSVIGDPGAYTVDRPGGPSPNPQPGHALVMIERLALAHVDQLRFTTPGSSGVGGTAWSEIDILGTASGTSDIVWSSSSTGAWETGGNWSGSSAPGGTETAVFNGTGTVLTVIPDTGRSVRNLTFDTASAGAYVIGSTGGNALTLAGGGAILCAPAVINVQTIDAPLVIAGANAKYTFTNDAADPAVTLDFGGGITGETAGSTLLMLTGANPGDDTVSGIIANGAATSFGIAKYGGGRWILSGPNTYSGATTIGGGTLQVDHATALGNGGDILFAGGTLQIGGNLNNATLSWGARIKNSTNAGAIAIDTNGQTVTLGGNIPSSNTGGLTKTGTGSLVLTGANSYGNTTLVNGGALMLEGVNSGNAALTVASTARLGGNGSTAAPVTIRSGGGLVADISDWDGAAGTGFGDLAVASLDLSDAAWTLDIRSSTFFSNFSETNRTLPFLVAPGGITGFSAANVTIPPPAGFPGTGIWSVQKTGNTLELVYTSGSSSPYQTWASAKALVSPNADPDDDPDKDGNENLSEFAFNGNPLGGSDTGYHRSATEDTNADTLKELTLTLAVRNGSGTPVFTGTPSPAASVDGITYTIEGSLGLTFPGSAVTETAAPTGLPVLPNGWEYRRFRLDASSGLPDKGFLRARITKP